MSCLKKIRTKTIVIFGGGVIVALSLWLFVIFVRPEIQTSAGTIVITKARLANGFPPGCNSGSPNCYQARPGYQILILHLKRKYGGEIVTLSKAIPDKELYVVADDGSRAEWFGTNVSIRSSRMSTAFVVQDSQRNFKLMWPGEAAIDLQPILYFLP